MNPVEAIGGGLRKVFTIDQRMSDLAEKAGRLEASVDDIDRRLIRLETVVQFATGTSLPPLSPRLPR
jgi:hypothetical protein